MGIRSKLILSTCLPLLIIYVVVLGLDYVKSSEEALHQIEQLVAQRASAEALQVNARLTAVQQVTARAASLLANRSGGPGGGPGGPEAGPLPLLPSLPPLPPEGAPALPSTLDGPPPSRGFGGFGEFGRSGGRIVEGLMQSQWTSAIFVRYEPGAARPTRTPELFGMRRARTERPPFESFAPNPVAAARIAAKAAAERKGVWLEPDEAGDVGLGPACVYAEPFYSPEDGVHLGVVCASVPVEALRYLRTDSPIQSQLRRILSGQSTTRPATEAEAPRPLARGGYLLIDRLGRILSRPDGRRQGTPLAVGPDDDELRAAIDRSLKGSGEIVLAGGLNEALGESAPRARYVLAMEPLPATGWLYVTAAPESDLLGPVQERLVRRGVYLGGSLLVLVGIVSVVLTRFCRPIEQMATTVQRLASGDLDIAPVPVAARDELGQLAKGFNDMTGRLRHHVRELTEQTAEREKVDSELRIARQIQSDLLPRTFPPFPDRQEFALHAVNIPARHIAGDFFDFFFRDDQLTIVIADVSGKGVPAALMMAVTRTMVRNLSESGLSPRAIVERLNRMLVEETKPGLFVTMMLGQYEPHTGRLTYVNAGHPPALCVRRGDGAATCCPPTGPLLGVDNSGLLGPFEQETIVLSPGDTLLLYTDGVTEAHDASNVMFGERRLIDRATALADAEPPDLCEGVVSTVMAYQHQNAADDVTLVALQRR